MSRNELRDSSNDASPLRSSRGWSTLSTACVFWVSHAFPCSCGMSRTSRGFHSIFSSWSVSEARWAHLTWLWMRLMKNRKRIHGRNRRLRVGTGRCALTAKACEKCNSWCRLDRFCLLGAEWDAHGYSARETARWKSITIYSIGKNVYCILNYRGCLVQYCPFILA
jgi:hypothetical protein